MIEVISINDEIKRLRVIDVKIITMKSINGECQTLKVLLRKLINERQTHK